MTDEKIMELSIVNQMVARDVVKQAGILEAWESVGARVNLIGSLKMGLLVKHRDIDFHIYTPDFRLADSFTAMKVIASQPGVERIEFRNLAHTEEACFEWHAWCRAADGELWQIDMIHIREGSAYDGYMEHVSDRILEVMTPEHKETILRIKYETPEGLAVFGIQYYVAVIRDGVRTYAEFVRWLDQNPPEGIFEWVP